MQITSAPTPTFLVIGAMKAGTTTLYNDLKLGEGIALTVVKEPDYLSTYTDIAKIRQSYARAFRGQERTAVRGDFSTTYSMWPEISGVPERALQACGENVRLVYLVRNPLHRIVSHYHHWAARAMIKGPIDTALLRDPRFVSYSSYFTQARQWLDRFPQSQMLIIKFEDYVAHRAETVDTIRQYLGAPTGQRSPNQSDRWNEGGGTRVTRGLTRRLAASRMYREHVRPLAPTKMRHSISGLLLRPPPPRVLPRKDTLEALAERLTADLVALRLFLGEETALWDLSDSMDGWYSDGTS